jgi:NTP pyrophosphatase (non-canonical NTP hydrolase)
MNKKEITSGVVNIDLKELQKLLKSKELSLRIKFETLTKKEKDILTKMVKLQEETGELANDILAVLSLQRKAKLEEFDKKNMYEEFADVILSTIFLANGLGVDINRAVNEKLAKVLSRAK